MEENQGEMGYEGSPVNGACEFQKDDAACATANFKFFDARKPVGSAKLAEHSGKKGNVGERRLFLKWRSRRWSC